MNEALMQAKGLGAQHIPLGVDIVMVEHADAISAIGSCL